MECKVCAGVCVMLVVMCVVCDVAVKDLVCVVCDMSCTCDVGGICDVHVMHGVVCGMRVLLCAYCYDNFKQRTLFKIKRL